MAKNKELEKRYKEEGKRRTSLRKVKRLEKYTKNIKDKKWRNSCTCGEDPYCYCGDGTPYSY